MTKISKSVKDANPGLYGYASPEAISGNWVPFVDADGDLRFVPCSYEFFKWYSNEKRKEELQKQRDSRCLVFSKRYKGLVRCMEDCKKCPHGKQFRDRNLSLERLKEVGIEPGENGETSYDEDETPNEARRKIKFAPIQEDKPSLEDEMRMEAIWREVAKFCDQDQIILKLFNQGKTDAAIAEVVNLSRDAVKKRRQRLIEKLKKKLL